jgi:hypothetical protein
MYITQFFLTNGIAINVRSVLFLASLTLAELLPLG